MLDVLDDDATRILARTSATSHACQARGIWRMTRHRDKQTALYTAADRQQTNQVSTWHAEWGSRQTRPTRRHFRKYPREDDGVSGVSARMSQGCYKDAIRPFRSGDGAESEAFARWLHH